jgi:peptidylprolyl isomerase
MRRIAVLLAPLLLATLALTACGSSPSSSAQAAVTVTGNFNKEPSVKIPAAKAPASLQAQTVIHGTGPTVASTDAFVGNYTLYIWSGATHRLVQSTYKSVPALFSGRLLPGLQTALKNQKVGSRVLAVIPPKDGFGTSGNPQGGVKGTDTLVFIIDLLKSYAGTAAAAGSKVSTGGHGLPTVSAGNPPTVTIPKNGNPPANLTSTTLIEGSGPPVAPGQQVVVQYVGVLWRTGKPFDSSWSRKAPFSFVVGLAPTQGGVITGWSSGLVGKKVGSRILLTIPPKDGYGTKGDSTAGIKGTDTLVFVVDILGTYSKGS